MGLTDKTDRPRQEGRRRPRPTTPRSSARVRKEERKGEAKDQLADAQDKVEDKAAEVADLERKT